MAKKRREYSAAERKELWERRRRGESVSGALGPLLNSSSVLIGWQSS